MQCGCCGERLYWRPKTEQWFCRQCGMWTKPIQEKELSDAITIKLEWIQRHSEVIRSPTTQRNVQSVKAAKLAREIQTDLLETEPNADALIAKILRRAELEYEFCSAGDADPATMQIRKACDITDPNLVGRMCCKALHNSILWRFQSVQPKIIAFRSGPNAI